MVSGTAAPRLQLLVALLGWPRKEAGAVQSADDQRPFISNGGWRTFPADMLVQPGPCNIDIRDRTLSEKEFLSKYAYSRPVVIRDSADNDLFRALTER